MSEQNKYVVTVMTSLSQDGNSDFISSTWTFGSKEEAERFATEKTNGWVHCYINGEHFTKTLNQ